MWTRSSRRGVSPPAPDVVFALHPKVARRLMAEGAAELAAGAGAASGEAPLLVIVRLNEECLASMRRRVEQWLRDDDALGAECEKARATLEVGQARLAERRDGLGRVEKELGELRAGRSEAAEYRLGRHRKIVEIAGADVIRAASCLSEATRRRDCEYEVAMQACQRLQHVAMAAQAVVLRGGVGAARDDDARALLSLLSTPAPPLPAELRRPTPVVVP